MVGRTARGVGDNTEPMVGKSLEEGAVRLLRRAADEGAADEMYDRAALASELGQQHVARADPLPPPCRPRRRRCPPPRVVGREPWVANAAATSRGALSGLDAHFEARDMRSHAARRWGSSRSG